MSEYSSSELFSKALELQQCAHCWVDEAKLLGNVSAKELRAVMKDYLKLRLEKGIDDENNG